MEIYANIGVDRQFGYKRGNLSRLSSVKRLSKTRLLHNFG